MMPRERLTPKEIQVATLVWEGLTNREIGRLMGTSEQVIKNHLRSTFDKLGVWSRLELAMYVASHGGKNWLEDATAGLRARSRRRELEPNRVESTANSCGLGCAAVHLLQKVCTLDLQGAGITARKTLKKH